MLRTGVYHDSVKKTPRVVPDLREVLDEQASMGSRGLDSDEGRLATYHSGQRKIIPKKILLESEGYVKPSLKRKAAAKVDKRAVVEDIKSYMQKLSQTSAVQIPQHQRIVRVTSSGDSSKKLVISRNLRQSSYRPDFDKDISSTGFHIYPEAGQGGDFVQDYDEHSEFVEDYDEHVSRKGLNMHSYDTPNLVIRSSKSDLLQKPAQSRLSNERLEKNSVLQRKLVAKQDVKGKFDSIPQHESYGLRSDKLNDLSYEDTHDGALAHELAGLIFMCNDRQRINCFRHKVLGMPKSKIRLLDHVKPGTKLFLFEFESRQLWGVFEAASYPGVELESEAFRGAEVDFPLQVRFSVYQQCDPLQEVQFKEAIKENYFSMRKFQWALNAEQVSKLIRLFCSSPPPVSRGASRIVRAARQPSVSRSVLHAFRYHERGSLPDSRRDNPSLEERDIVGQTRREILCGNNSLRKLPTSANSKLVQNDYGLGNLSENLEFDDVDGGSSTTSGRYMIVREHVMRDLTKLQREHLVKDTNKFNKDWVNPEVDACGEEGRDDHCGNELEVRQLRNNPPYTLGAHLDDDVLEGHVDTLYMGLNEKDSLGRSSDSVPAFSTKGAGPLKICLQESNGRAIKRAQRAEKDLDGSVAYPSLASSVKRRSAENIGVNHIGLVNARYNVRKAWENEMEQLSDLKQLEPSASSYHDVGSTPSVSLSMLDNKYLDAERTMISQKSFLVSKSNKVVQPVITPTYEFQKFQQPSCNDVTGDMTTVKRKFSSLANDGADYMSSRVVDTAGKIRVAVKNDPPRNEPLRDKGEIHRTDGNERTHFKENLFVSVSNLKNKPSVRLPMVSQKSSSKSTVSSPVLKAETSEPNQQKKLTVWARLSAPGPNTYSTMRSRSLSLEETTIRSRSISVEEMKHSDESVSEQDYETDIPIEEDYYSVNEFEVIDTPNEDFVIDFKRRKNIHGSEEQKKSDVATDKASKATSSLENNIQNDFDVQKKRRRLIRPEIVSSDAKSMLAANAVVEKQQNASVSTVEKANTDSKN